MNDRELLWKLFADNRDQARFHETQRTNGTGLIAAGAAAVLTAITHDQKITVSDLPLAAFLSFVGLFGLFFCQKEYERMRLHLRRAETYLVQLDATDQTYDLMKMREQCDRDHRRRYFLSSRIRLNFFWQFMNILIFLFGILIIYNIVLENQGLISLLRILHLWR